MNENIDLTKILKDCPKDTKLYSPIFGEVTLYDVLSEEDNYPIRIRTKSGNTQTFNRYGLYYIPCANDAECLLFPSKENRDWSKFKVNKPKFDPKTLNPFDKVLVRDFSDDWNCEFFSHVIFSDVSNQYATIGNYYQYCIPYDENTKHLVGTTEEPPEYYRYWED